MPLSMTAPTRHGHTPHRPLTPRPRPAARDASSSYRGPQPPSRTGAQQLAVRRFASRAAAQHAPYAQQRAQAAARFGVAKARQLSRRGQRRRQAGRPRRQQAGQLRKQLQLQALQRLEKVEADGKSVLRGRRKRGRQCARAGLARAKRRRAVLRCARPRHVRRAVRRALPEGGHRNGPASR
jgi:hypothetical protein